MPPRSLLIALALLGARSVVAAGFAIGEQGAAAVGKAGAFVAEASDPSAVTYNPAGLASLEGLQFYLGLSLVAPSSSFTAEETGEKTEARLACTFADAALCNSKVAPIPNLYLSYELARGSTLGFGVTSPFGLGVRWSWTDQSPQRYVVREQSLSALFLSPVIAFDASSYLSGLAVALGADIVPAHLSLRRDIPLGERDGSVHLGGSATGAGGRMGLLYSPRALTGVRVGLTWRSPVTLHFHGRGDFEVDEGVPRSALPPDGKVSTRLVLPQSAALGVAYRPWPWLAVEGDVEWVDWSVLDEIVIRLPDGSSSTDEKGWRDTFAVRAGAVAKVWLLTVRGGVAYDRSAVSARRLAPSPPDADRVMASGGIGFQLSRGWRLEAAALHVLPASRKSAERLGEHLSAGTYRISAWALSVGLAFALSGSTTADNNTQL